VAHAARKGTRECASARLENREHSTNSAAGGVLAPLALRDSQQDARLLELNAEFDA
jgi:hypothetical protein